jgi:hypothetical protein
MADIKLIKFASGEEIICTLVSETETTKSVKQAVTLVYRPQEGGKMTTGFAPHMPYSEGQITIHNTAIQGIADVAQDVYNEYNRIFGSGIVVASANSIPLTK